MPKRGTAWDVPLHRVGARGNSTWTRSPRPHGLSILDPSGAGAMGFRSGNGWTLRRRLHAAWVSHAEQPSFLAESRMASSS